MEALCTALSDDIIAFNPFLSGGTAGWIVIDLQTPISPTRKVCIVFPAKFTVPPFLPAVKMKIQ